MLGDTRSLQNISVPNYPDSASGDFMTAVGLKRRQRTLCRSGVCVDAACLCWFSTHRRILQNEAQLYFCLSICTRGMLTACICFSIALAMHDTVTHEHWCAIIICVISCPYAQVCVPLLSRPRLHRPIVWWALITACSSIQVLQAAATISFRMLAEPYLTGTLAVLKDVYSTR